MADHLGAGVASRAHRSMDSLHSLIYFAPEAEEEFTGIGLKPGRMNYFASRSAPMGPVSRDVTIATFYNFHPGLVARSIPQAWQRATCADVLAGRLRVVDRAYRRLLGAAAVTGPQVAEAAVLAREAATGLSTAGRPLFAGHAGLDWPEDPHLTLWHAISLLREYRGDGHVAVLLLCGLTGLEALVTHTATGRGFTEAAAKATRGWSDDEWSACVADLRARGLLDEDGLTDAGRELRAGIEADTDRLGADPWLQLGPEQTARLTELTAALTKTVVAAGAFPTGVFSPRR